MTTAAENELLTRTGPGTPMGELMREYWMPVARSDEVAADGEPRRLMILGEKLIAFRDSEGRVGVFDHRCPHRCASLFFGRNEEGGIRCVYHGWKFDVYGNCLEMANVPPHQDFRHKVHAKAYPAQDRFGVIWIYMGARKVPPPFPDFELHNLTQEDITIQFVHQDANWLQSLENDLDTSHFGFLHYGAIDPEWMEPDDPMRVLATERQPEFLLEETPAGLMYASHRPADAANTYWRLGHYLVPFWVFPPAGPLAGLVVAKAYLPLDDTHCMVIGMYSKSTRQMRPMKNGQPVPGMGTGPNRGARYLPNTTDWLGRWRLVTNRENDYLIDRAAQRSGGVYSGIDGVQVQDTAIAETMGPITDRTFEHLAASDETIARARRKLLRLVQAYGRDKTTPLPGVDDPGIYRGHRGGFFTAPSNRTFRDVYGELIDRYAGEAPRWAAE
jgi:phenylpropionate dioxygenase-like ring-hydroxylating dioxygenase large terminal subunit